MNVPDDFMVKKQCKTFEEAIELVQCFRKIVSKRKEKMRTHI
jgi:putative sigma-54 modulation protein